MMFSRPQGMGSGQMQQASGIENSAVVQYLIDPYVSG
jgi:hypothetical protein